MFLIKNTLIFLQILLLFIVFIKVSKSSSANLSNNNVEIKYIPNGNYKNKNFSFTKLTPIKYMTDEEKNRLKKELKDIVEISARTGSTEFYFYNQLESDEKYLYDIIKSESSKTLPELTIEIEVSNVDDPTAYRSGILKKLEKIFTILAFENPELWWIGNFLYSCDIDSSKENTLVVFLVMIPDLNYTDEEVSAKKEEIKNKNNEIEIEKVKIMTKINKLGLKTNYAILRYIHDYLITKNVYTLNNSLENIRNLYGGLVEGICVCEGYAEAFQYLARQFGINCTIARSATHEWNFVEMGGKWYVMDVTYDDPVSMKDTYSSGDNRNLLLDYFLTGTEHERSTDNLKYSEDEERNLIYSAFGDDVIFTYPDIEQGDYIPSEEEQNELALINITLTDEEDICIPDSDNAALRNTCNGYYMNTAKDSLLLCQKSTEIGHETETVCPVQESTGYFYNADSSDANHKYIICTKTTSNITPISCTGTSQPGTGTTDCTNPGDLVSGGNQESVLLCVTNSDKIEIFKGDKNNLEFIPSNVLDKTVDDNTKYNVIQLKQNSVEPIDVTEDAVYNYHNMVMKCSSATKDCTAMNDLGFYVNSAATLENQKKLIKCKDNQGKRECQIESTNAMDGYYLNAAATGTATKNLIYCSTESGKCEVQKTPATPGFYINAGNTAILIVCNDISCSVGSSATKAGIYLNAAEPSKLITCNGVDSCTASSNDITSGYYVNAAATSDNQKKLIICDNTNCRLEENDSTIGYYEYTPASDITINNKIIIHCDGTKCATEESSKVKNGYYIYAKNNKKLIKCETTCDLIETPNEGHYVNALNTNKLIKCDGKTGCAASVNDSTQGYYLNAGVTGTDSLKLILCNDECNIQSTTTAGVYINADSNENIINCSLTECKLEYLDGYSINAVYTEDDDTKKLIICKDNQCSESEAIINGFYFNSALKSANKAIRCDKDKCELVDVTTKSDCTNDKYRLIEKSGLKFCNDDTEEALPVNDAIAYYNFKVSGTLNYPSITISNIPEENTKEIIVEVSKYSIVQFIGSICLDGHSKKGCEIGIDILKTCSSFDSECTESSVGGCIPQNSDNPIARSSCKVGYYFVENSLYYCYENESINGQIDCTIKSIMGYFVNLSTEEGAKELVKCYRTSSSGPVTCTGIDKPKADITTCANANSSDFLMNGRDGKIMLCTDTNDEHAIEIFTEDNEKYFVPAATFSHGNGIGSNKYYVVTVNKNSIQQQKLNASARHYNYTFARPKILSAYSSSQCAASDEDLREYEISSDNDDTYKLNTYT